MFGTANAIEPVEIARTKPAVRAKEEGPPIREATRADTIAAVPRPALSRASSRDSSRERSREGARPRRTASPAGYERFALSRDRPSLRVRS